METEQKLTVAGVSLAVGIIGLAILNPFVVVNTGEVGLVKSFGVIQDRVMSPGINLKRPVIDGVMVFNTKTQAIADGKGEYIHSNAYTKDNQPIVISYDVIYNQNPITLKKIYSKYGRDVVSNNVYSYVETAFKTVMGKYTATQLITDREKVRQEVIKTAREYVIDKDLDVPIVRIQNIPITDIKFDESYTSALRNKQVELEKARQKEYELMSAKKEAEITVTKAKADAESIKIRAMALKSSPNLVQLEAVKKWNGLIPLTAKTVMIGDCKALNAVTGE